MTSIDMLSDDVLLEIFDFHGCYDHDVHEEKREKAWRTLVHVCRRWRSIVFGSPRHLNLKLICTHTTPARNMLDIWPFLPLIVVFYEDSPTGSVDNIIAALECTDRVCQIYLLDVQSLDLEIFLAAMQQPFPELRFLQLCPDDEIDGTVPDSFLGGSAPRLDYLWLEGIAFPGLPKLLLSATHLRLLDLFDIPHSGYISPDEMVAVLSTLTRLKHLSLRFVSPRSCPDQASRRPPPSTRPVLPVLTYLSFKGVSEYLDDLMACIDAPQLDLLDITFFNDVVFDTPQLVRFISHMPMSKALGKAYITLQDRAARVSFSSQSSYDGICFLKILCRGLDWQVSSLEQVCTLCLPPLFVLEDLFLLEDSDSQPDWKVSIENGQWLELLRPFMAVKNLYLSGNFASRVASALQEVIEGRTTDVLPALQNIFLKELDSSGSVHESFGHFVAARQAANHLIVISPWTV